MKSYSTIFIILMLIMIVFISMQQVGEEIINNKQLEADSKILISNVSNNIDTNLNLLEDFNESQSSSGANFDGEDIFAQEFLQGEAEGQSKRGIVQNIVKVPDLVFLSIGLPESSTTWLKSLLALIIVVILSFATYRSIFGGGKVTDN